MLGDVKVSRSQVKDEIVLEGNDVTHVSQSGELLSALCVFVSILTVAAAASVWQPTLVKDKDIRKFLDGIYVSERGVME